MRQCNFPQSQCEPSTVASFQPVAEPFGEMLRNMSSVIVNGLLTLKIATLHASSGLPS
jgi:hypothetical protein